MYVWNTRAMAQNTRREFRKYRGIYRVSGSVIVASREGAEGSNSISWRCYCKEIKSWNGVWQGQRLVNIV